MQYVIGINIVNVRWTHNDRWSAHNLINNIIYNNYLLLSLVTRYRQLSIFFPTMASVTDSYSSSTSIKNIMALDSFPQEGKSPRESLQNSVLETFIFWY
jgi:hypothetical protein